MIRNLKALGLAAIAVFAVTAMVAPAAQAVPTFTTGKTTAAPATNDHTATSVVGTQYGANITDDSFTSVIGNFTCSDSLSTFTASATGTDAELTVTPHYTHCTTITKDDTPGTPLTVTPNGCDFTFEDLTTVTAGPPPIYSANVKVVCPPDKSIEIEVYAAGTVTSHSVKICTLKVGSTKSLGGITIAGGTSGGRDDLTVSVTTPEIPYTTSGICGVTAGESVYHSKLTLTSSTHDIWLSD